MLSLLEGAGLGGCVCSDWKPYSELQAVAPWVGPGERAQLERRVCPYPGGGRMEWRWRSCSGRFWNPDDLGERVTRMLRASGSFRLVEPSPGRIDPFWKHVQRPQVIPLQMSVVCLDPLVVVLADGDSPYYGFTYYRIEPEGEAGYGLPGGSVVRTTFPKSGNLMWISPGFSVRPKPPGREGETYAIPVSWGRLLLVDTGGFYEARPADDG